MTRPAKIIERPLAALAGAVGYQRFLDGIEASERVYHHHDVVPCLQLAAELAVQSEGGGL